MYIVKLRLDMKYYFVILTILAVNWQLLLAAPKNYISSIVDGISKAKITDDLIDGNNIPLYIQNVTININRDTEQENNENSENIRDLLQNDLQELISAIQVFQEGLAIEIVKQLDAVKRKVLTNIARSLASLSESLRGFPAIVAAIRNQWIRDIVRRQSAITQEWDDWAINVLSSIALATNYSKVILDQSVLIIGEFEVNYRSALAACANDIEAEVLEYEESVRTLAKRYKSVIDDLQHEVQLCLNADATAAETQNCVKGTSRLLRKLYNAPNDISQLRRSVTVLYDVTYKAASCLVQLSKQILAERDVIQRKLVDLLIEYIKNNNDNNQSNENDSNSSDSDENDNSSSNDSSDNSSEDSSDSSSEDSSDSSSEASDDSSSSDSSDSSSSDSSDSSSSVSSDSSSSESSDS